MDPMDYIVRIGNLEFSCSWIVVGAVKNAISCCIRGSKSARGQSGHSPGKSRKARQAAPRELMSPDRRVVGYKSSGASLIQHGANISLSKTHQPGENSNACDTILHFLQCVNLVNSIQWNCFAHTA